MSFAYFGPRHSPNSCSSYDIAVVQLLTSLAMMWFGSRIETQRLHYLVCNGLQASKFNMSSNYDNSRFFLTHKMKILQSDDALGPSLSASRQSTATIKNSTQSSRISTARYGFNIKMNKTFYELLETTVTIKNSTQSSRISTARYGFNIVMDESFYKSLETTATIKNSTQSSRISTARYRFQYSNE